MSHEEFKQEVGYYLADIKKFTDQEDFGSAQIMLTGLRKLIADRRKAKKSNVK